MSITLAAHPLEPLSRSPCSSRTPTPCVHAAAAVTQMPSPPTTTPPSSQSSSTSSPSTTITPLFHLQLTAASSVSLALDATTSLPASGPAFGQADDTPVEDDIDETGSATSELPYPACDLKRVRFPCPVAEAERFAVRRSYSLRLTVAHVRLRSSMARGLPSLCPLSRSMSHTLRPSTIGPRSSSRRRAGRASCPREGPSGATSTSPT